MDNEKLAREAEFQNQKTESKYRGEKNPRDNFYFVLDQAKKDFNRILADASDDSRVLIVGCAEGGVTPLARKNTKRVVGIDIAETPIAMLNEALEREGLADKAAAMVMNAENLEFPDHSFDVICCTGVLHHLEIKPTIESWSRALSPHGKVIMLEPLAYNPFIWLYRMITPSMRTPDEHPLVPADFRLIGEKFDLTSSRFYALTSIALIPVAMLIGKQRIPGGVLRFFQRLDDLLVKVLPPLKHLCWAVVIVGEKRA